jgi:S-adenosylmethionine-diacylgycerolhomoserine-N-methlytransferase
MTGTVAQARGARDAHRLFLNRYYGISRHFYDFTRKYYLFGRDAELALLAKEKWNSLLEIGPGTGRNLIELHRLRPHAVLGGLEASDEMLTHAEKHCAFARFRQGFAEDAPLSNILGQKPERILFSYCLSMVTNPEAALENAVNALPPNGEVVLVDFGDFSGLPASFQRAMTSWLKTFHVNPVSSSLLSEFGAEMSYGPFGYYLRARIRSKNFNSPASATSSPEASK